MTHHLTPARTPSPRYRSDGSKISYHRSAAADRSPKMATDLQDGSSYSGWSRESPAPSTVSGAELADAHPYVGLSTETSWLVLLSGCYTPRRRASSVAPTAAASSSSSHLPVSNNEGVRLAQCEDRLFELQPTLQGQVRLLARQIGLSYLEANELKMSLEIERPGAQESLCVSLSDASWKLAFARFIGRSGPRGAVSSSSRPDLAPGLGCAADTWHHHGEVFDMVNGRAGDGSSADSSRPFGTDKATGLSFSRRGSNAPRLDFEHRFRDELPLPPLTIRTGMPIAARITFSLGALSMQRLSNPFIDLSAAQSRLEGPVGGRDRSTSRSQPRPLALAQTHPLANHSVPLARSTFAPGDDGCYRSELATSSALGNEHVGTAVNAPTPALDVHPTHHATDITADVDRREQEGTVSERKNPLQSYEERAEEENDVDDEDDDNDNDDDDDDDDNRGENRSCCDSTPGTGQTTMSSANGDEIWKRSPSSSLLPSTTTDASPVFLGISSQFGLRPLGVHSSPFAVSPLGIVVPIENQAGGPRTGITRRRATTALPPFRQAYVAPTAIFAAREDPGPGEPCKYFLADARIGRHSSLGLQKRSLSGRKDGGGERRDEFVARDRHESFSQRSGRTSTTSSIFVPHENEWPTVYHPHAYLADSSQSPLHDGGARSTVESASASPEASSPREWSDFGHSGGARQEFLASGLSPMGLSDYAKMSPGSAWAGLQGPSQSPNALRKLCLAASDWQEGVLAANSIDAAKEGDATALSGIDEAKPRTPSGLATPTAR
ncbi:hypothetical protein ACQY0O_004750 [Thecaphora frezii]